MRIWITEIGEPLPLESGARLLRYGQLCPEWARLGHEVTWWTSSFSHANRIFVRHSDCEANVEGVKLKILHGPGYRRSVSLRRVWHQGHFARRFAKISRTQIPPDLILTPIPTLEVARQAVALGRERGIPVLIDIRDEWPDEFMDLFPKMLQPLARVALTKQFRDVSFICKNATGIIGTGTKFLEYGLRYAKRPTIPEDHVFPFGYRVPVMNKTSLREARHWWLKQGVDPDAFLICFFGTMGNFFDLDTVIEAAKRLENKLKVQFVLCGTGHNVESLKRKAAGVRSVLFPGWVGGEPIASMMGMAHVGLAPYRRGARMALPNKPIEYMAGGLVVLSSLEGELQSLLETHDCGVKYTADDACELASAIQRLAADPARLQKMRENASSLFQQRFELSQIAKDMAEHFDKIVRTTRLSARPA